MGEGVEIVVGVGVGVQEKLGIEKWQKGERSRSWGQIGIGLNDKGNYEDIMW